MNATVIDLAKERAFSAYLTDLLNRSGGRTFGAARLAAELAGGGKKPTRLETAFAFFDAFDQLSADIEIRFRETAGLARALERSSDPAAVTVGRLIAEDYERLLNFFDALTDLSESVEKFGWREDPVEEAVIAAECAGGVRN